MLLTNISLRSANGCAQREIPEASKQPECYIKSCNAQFQFREVTENEVFNLLSNISTKKATGPDKIPAKLVKISAPFTTKHLSIIFKVLMKRNFLRQFSYCIGKIS